MKLVLVNGSPHGDRGGTARIAGWLLEAAAEAGAQAETFPLSELRVDFCRGCGSCMNSGLCPREDDVPRVHEAWETADLVVLASPVHVFHVTGAMKTFIDRTAALFHRPPLEGRYGAVVTSSAGMGESRVIEYLSLCLEALGAGYVGAVWGTYRPPGRLWEPEAVRERARRLGRELVAAAREKRDYALRDEVISKRRFLRELIRQNRKIFRADHRYWEEHGWYDHLPGTRRPRR